MTRAARGKIDIEWAKQSKALGGRPQ